MLLRIDDRADDDDDVRSFVHYVHAYRSRAIPSASGIVQHAACNNFSLICATHMLGTYTHFDNYASNFVATLGKEAEKSESVPRSLITMTTMTLRVCTLTGWSEAFTICVCVLLCRRETSVCCVGCERRLAVVLQLRPVGLETFKYINAKIYK